MICLTMGLDVLLGALEMLHVTTVQMWQEANQHATLNAGMASDVGLKFVITQLQIYQLDGDARQVVD